MDVAVGCRPCRVCSSVVFGDVGCRISRTVVGAGGLFPRNGAGGLVV